MVGTMRSDLPVLVARSTTYGHFDRQWVMIRRCYGVGDSREREGVAIGGGKSWCWAVQIACTTPKSAAFAIKDSLAMPIVLAMTMRHCNNTRTDSVGHWGRNRCIRKSAWASPGRLWP